MRCTTDEDYEDLPGATGHPDYHMAQAALVASFVVRFDLVLVDIVAHTCPHQVTSRMANSTGCPIHNGMATAGKKADFRFLRRTAYRKLDFTAVLEGCSMPSVASTL